MVAYVGILDGFDGDAQRSQKSEFSYIKYKIAGKHGSRGQSQVLTFLPEFFSPDFKVSGIKKTYGDRAKAVEFVYHNNVYVDGGLATLDAFCGSETVLDELSDEAARLSEYTTDSVSELLKGFFRSLGPVEFGYVVKQRREKRPDGTKARSKYVDIDSFFRADEKSVKRIVKRSASKSEWLAEQIAAGKDVSNADELLIGFDTEAYGVASVREEPSWVSA